MYARFNSIDNWHEEVDHYGPDADIWRTLDELDKDSQR